MNQKRKRKNKNKSILYLLLLAILTCIAISGTFARYTTSQTGIGEAVVAKWSFNVDGLDKTSLVRTTMTDTIVDGRLAPGTEGYLPIEIDAWETEVALDYEIEILDIKNKPENLNFYTNSTYTTKIEGVEKEVTNENGTITTQTTYTLKGHMSLAEVLNENTARKTVRMYWQWPFETAGENSDEQDTLDGLAGSMEFSVKVVGSQSLEDAPEVTTYKINYDLNNGTGEIRSQTKQEGIDAKITSLVPTRTGYKFLGWATKEDATEVTYVAGDTFAVDTDTTLYAVWQAETCTITYNYSHNGGTSAAGENTVTVDVAYGSEVELKQDAVKNGYDFAGWSTSSSTNDTIDSLVMGKDITLYAVYSKDVTVTYNYYENNSEVAKQTTIYNDQVLRMNITEEIPIRPKYVFVNWKDNEGTSYNPGDEITTTEDITLYAQWEDAVATTETTGYETLALAMAGATSGQTVTMLQDSTETASTTVSGKTLTLDLNGKTVTSNTEGTLMTLSDGSNLTVQDSKGNGTITSATTIINNASTGTVTLSSGKLTGPTTENAYNATKNPAGVLNSGGGTININGGTLEFSTNCIKNASGTVTINNGQLNQTYNGNSGIWNYGTVEMNGGTITAEGWGIHSNQGKVNMTAGTISSNYTGIKVIESATANITGGTINAYNKNVDNPSAIDNYGTVTVSGDANFYSDYYGIYNAHNETGVVNVESGVIETKYTGIMNTGTLNVYDGTITGATYGIYSGNESSIINISGGNIGGAVTQTVVRTAGTLNITGGTIYSTAGAGIRSTGKVTISGDDTLIQKSGTLQGSVIQIEGSGTAEFLGGTIQALEDTGSHAIWSNSTGTIIIDGATIKQLGTGRAVGNENTGVIKVISGSIMAKGGNALVNTSTGTITIGDNTNAVSTTDPEITSETAYGIIVNSGTLNFYDGVIKGKTMAISGTPICATGYEAQTVYDGTNYVAKLIETPTIISEIETGYTGEVTLSGSVGVPQVKSNVLNLSTTKKYMVEFDYYCLADTNKFNVDLYGTNAAEDVEIQPISTTKTLHYKWIFTPWSADMASCYLRFFDNQVASNESNIIISNIKMYEVE